MGVLLEGWWWIEENICTSYVPQVNDISAHRMKPECNKDTIAAENTLQLADGPALVS